MRLGTILSFWALASLACAPSEVEETGYLVAGEVGYTSNNTLDVATDETVTIVGRRGAITRLGGDLEIYSERLGTSRPATLSSDAGGAFVVTTPALAGDSLELIYTVDGETSRLALALDDDLSTVPAPACLNCVGLLISPPNGDGIATVELSELELSDGRVIVYNGARGAVESAPSTSASIVIPAEIGDEVCAYETDSLGNQSTTTCGLVPPES